MPAIAIRQSAVQAMTSQQRRLARWVLESVGIVDPAQFTAPGGATWFVFDDDRITLKDAAYFGCFAAKLAQLPADYTPPDALDDATVAEARAWVRQKLEAAVVWPVNVAAGADPWQAVLDAQNAPAAVGAGGAVPSTWIPVTE